MKSGLLREYQDVLHATQRLVDITLVAAVHLVATWAYSQHWRPESSNATLIALLAFSVSAELCSLYRPWRVERLRVEIRTVVLVWTMTVAVMVTSSGNVWSRHSSRIDRRRFAQWNGPIAGPG